MAQSLTTESNPRRQGSFKNKTSEQSNPILYTGIIWWGKILVNHAGKSYWQGKIWQTNNSQCIWHIYFPCICEYWRVKFWQIRFAKFTSSSLPKFSCVWYSLRNKQGENYYLTKETVDR